LENILKQLLPSDNYENCLEHQRAAEDLARRWLEDREAKTEVIKLLRKFQLDETAIEAEAFRLRGEDLECLDRMLALEMARRDKVIFVLAEYRHTLAKFLQVSDQILEEDETPNLWPWRNVQVDHGKPEADRGEPPQCTKEHRSPFGPWKKARESERLSSRAEQADAGCSVRERC
jgi:hypothetical protein